MKNNIFFLSIMAALGGLFIYFSVPAGSAKAVLMFGFIIGALMRVNFSIQTKRYLGERKNTYWDLYELIPLAAMGILFAIWLVNTALSALGLCGHIVGQPWYMLMGLPNFCAIVLLFFYLWGNSDHFNKIEKGEGKISDTPLFVKAGKYLAIVVFLIAAIYWANGWGEKAVAQITFWSGMVLYILFWLEMAEKRGKTGEFGYWTNIANLLLAIIMIVLSITGIWRDILPFVGISSIMAAIVLICLPALIPVVEG